MPSPPYVGYNISRAQPAAIEALNHGVRKLQAVLKHAPTRVEGVSLSRMPFSGPCDSTLDARRSPLGAQRSPATSLWALGLADAAHWGKSQAETATQSAEC